MRNRRENGMRNKPRRPVDRPNCGSGYYDDNGDYRFASEDIVDGLSVAAAWSSLYKCWRGYRIALGHDDWAKRTDFARRIVFYCRLLRKNEPHFDELQDDEVVSMWPAAQNGNP